MSDDFDFIPSSNTAGDVDPFATEHVDHVEEVTVEGDASSGFEGVEGDITVHEEIIEEPVKHYEFEADAVMSPLRQYQIKHEALLQEKAAKAEEKRQQTLTKAQADIANFYKEKALARETREANNRVSEQQFISDLESTLANAQSWESVGNLVDLQAKPIGNDTTRMRQILVQLKH